MPDLLFEIFSEEIPARMQAQAAQELKSRVTQALVEQNILYESAGAFVTPRRLTLHITGLPISQADRLEVRKGPKVGAPEAALEGFLKSTGLASLSMAQREEDPKKGAYYTAHLHHRGRATREVLAEILPEVLRTFPWPKSMRWGKNSSQPDAVRWVRPFHNLLALLHTEGEGAEVISFEIAGISTNLHTYGHRFHAPKLFEVASFEDYVTKLKAAYVHLDSARRADMIVQEARTLSFARALQMVEDKDLLDEVVGLVEWPVVLMGSFHPRFLVMPPELIRATIRTHQKCFVLQPLGCQDDSLSPYFLLVANLEATDGGKAIVAGNERVIRARLSDALFFWEMDRAPLPSYEQGSLKPLDQRADKLRKLGVVFHKSLGSQGERVARLEGLAALAACQLKADPALAQRAATLSKADLMTEVVGEFPELQGRIGALYARDQGEDLALCAALEEQYRPKGPQDALPNGPISIALALADKIDTLVGFWKIGEKPTGSKDPYALRRAALGVVRIVSEYSGRGEEHIDVSELLAHACVLHHVPDSQQVSLIDDVLLYFWDRFQILLKEKENIASDVTQAVLNIALYANPYPRAFHTPLPLSSQLRNPDFQKVRAYARALHHFLKTSEGENLLQAYRRARNILPPQRIEELKPARERLEKLPPAHPERIFATRLQEITAHLAHLYEKEAPPDHILSYLGQTLREPVDAFFVLRIQDPGEAMGTHTRLLLLQDLCDLMHNIADFSKLQR